MEGSDWIEQGPHEYRWLADKEDASTSSHRDLNRQDLSPDQDEVFAALYDWVQFPNEEMLFTLGGYAGTGKSTLLSLLGKLAGMLGMNIAFVTYTGKASNVLRQKLRASDVRFTKIPLAGCHFVGTIHSLIYRPKLDPDTGRIIGWKQAHPDEVPFNVIVVDEASMVDEEIFRDLKSYDLPIVAVGDHGQLPPIRGSFNLMESPQYRLEKIHRQAEGSPILRLSVHIREHGDLPKDMSPFEGVEQVPNAKLADLIGSSFVPHQPPSDVGLLCYSNATRIRMNAKVRGSVLGVPWDADPVAGDQVICLRNSFRIVFNGMRGQILKSANGGKHTYYSDILFDEERLELRAKVFKHQFSREKTFATPQEAAGLFGFHAEKWSELGMLFDFGYCLTVHKAQGSSFKHGIVLYERHGRQSDDDFRRWLYTAVTRASDKLTIVRG